MVNEQYFYCFSLLPSHSLRMGLGHLDQSGQFRIVSVETTEIFRSGIPPGTRNTIETYLLIFQGV